MNYSNSKHKSKCKKSNITQFSHIPVIAIILPITSNGNRINKNNPHPSQLLLMKYFYPSFLSSIEPHLYKYKLFIGYSYDDPYLSNQKFLNNLNQLMKDVKIDIQFIVHIFTRLVDMYNTIAKIAYDSGANYFITLNDDAILKTINWTSKMVNMIHNNPLLSEFGTTGFVGENSRGFIQFNFVSRLHFEIFNMTLYTPAIPNWGIDTWICEIYKPFNSCFINRDLVMDNHIGNSKERYEIDRHYRLKLKKELNHSIKVIKKMLFDYL